MLDFYEGELLRRTVLVRNALRRAASEGRANDAQLLLEGSGRAEQPTSVEQEQHDESDASVDLVAHVEVSDYDYDNWQDEDEESTTTTTTGENVWFQDLYDEVSVDQADVHVVSPTRRLVHPADRVDEETCPSLIEDEGNSTDESDDDESEATLSHVGVQRTSIAPLSKSQKDLTLDYDGGTPLSLSTSRKSRGHPSSYHDRIHNSRHFLSTSRPSVISY